jgi:hypothetical protein
MNAVLNAKLTWYASRASGLVAWSTVTASMLWGLALSTRLIRRKGAPAWLLELHKFLGTLSVVFVGIHVLALWADNYVYFGPRELFATYLLVAIQLTSWAMRRLPRKVWHAVHLTSFPLFAAATVHGFTAGADNTNLLVQWVALTGGMLLFVLAAFRLLSPRRGPSRNRGRRVTFGDLGTRGDERGDRRGAAGHREPVAGP